MLDTLRLRKKNKILIGVTGSFGSGKTAVSNLFKALGAAVINADQLAHEALSATGPVYKRIVKRFGPGCLGPSKAIDRKKMARLVFHDVKKRRALESLIHPYVFKRMAESIRKSQKKILILDVPLLFETGLNHQCDYTVVVNASRVNILERLHRKGYPPEEAQKRMRAQMALSQKQKLSDFVILNNGNFSKTRAQVRKIWKKISSVLKGDQ